MLRRFSASRRPGLRRRPADRRCSAGVATYFSNPPAPLASDEFHQEPKALRLASDGPFGKFDKRAAAARLPGLFGGLLGLPQPEAGRVPRPQGARLQRGRDQGDRVRLEDPGAVDQSRTPASRRPARRCRPTTSRRRSPNEIAARAANNNALPPDLSLITKAREGGAAYVYSLLTGYQNQPAALLKEFPDAKTPPDLHYNPYFANLNIAMPPPLTSEGQVTYRRRHRSRPSTRWRKDVAAFLVWTAEPEPREPPCGRARGRDLPAVRDDPRLSRLPATSGTRRSARSG